MHEVSRLLQAATALSQLLRDAGVPHAFHGNVLTAVFAKAAMADVSLGVIRTLVLADIAPQEICCIVDGGGSHPFRRVRQALSGNDDFSIVSSPWNNR